MPRVVAVILLLLVVGIPVADLLSMYRGQAEDRLRWVSQLQRKVTLLESENDRLRGLVSDAENVKSQARSEEWRRKIEADVEQIRGLKFKRPVVYSVVSRKEITTVMSKKLEEVYTEAEFANVQKALSLLGLLPPGYDLRKKYIELLGEQVAAFYDQHTHKLFMFSDASLESAQNQVILAHELTHALQDQNYDLLKFPLEIKDNDDRSLAASALIEGDATLVMTMYMMQHMSLKTLKDNVGGALSQNSKQLAEAPRYMREMLLFPYLRGQEFCQAMTEDHGMAGLTRCYQHLPASSAEILHPARFGHPAQDVTWPDTAFHGQPPAQSNVLGEASMRLYLQPAMNELEAMKLAARERGDRYLYFDKADALVLKTGWDGADAAGDFASTVRRAIGVRYHAPAWHEESGIARCDGARHWRLRITPPGAAVFIDAATAEDADALLQQFAP